MSKKKLTIIICTALIIILCAAAAIVLMPHESSVSVTEMLSTAQKYLVEMDYKRAIAEFNKVIELDPMNAEAYLGLAEAYEKNGQHDMAVETLEKGYEATGDERIVAAMNTDSVPENIGNNEDELIRITYNKHDKNMTRFKVQQYFSEIGIKAEFTEEYSDTVPEGCVISDNIPRNKTVSKDFVAQIVISLGEEDLTKTVPDLIGLEVTQAYEKLNEYSLNTYVIYGKCDENEIGKVIAQDPSVGTEADKNDIICLTVGRKNEEAVSECRHIYEGKGSSHNYTFYYDNDGNIIGFVNHWYSEKYNDDGGFIDIETVVSDGTQPIGSSEGKIVYLDNGQVSISESGYNSTNDEEYILDFDGHGNITDVNTYKNGILIDTYSFANENTDKYHYIKASDFDPNVTNGNGDVYFCYENGYLDFVYYDDYYPRKEEYEYNANGDISTITEKTVNDETDCEYTGYVYSTLTYDNTDAFICNRNRAITDWVIGR